MPRGLMFHIETTYIKLYHTPAESEPTEGKISNTEIPAQ
jgi:hypothetical protein